MAVRLRERIEAMVGDEHASFLRLARRFRRPLAALVSSFEERRRRWYRLVDSDVIRLLRTDHEPRATELASEIMGVRPDA